MGEIDFISENTHFLQAKRSGLDIVLAQNKILSESPMLVEIFSKISLQFQILNNDRQVVYMNQKLKDELENKGIEFELGYRPGEIKNCQNAFLEPGGCGTSKNCQYCNILQSVLEAKKQNSSYSQEAFFISRIDGKSVMYNYMVTAIPFNLQNENFVLLTFEDISDKKRKEQLEQTFFHDLLNKVNSISGFTDLMRMDPETEDNQYVKMLKRGISELADEIKYHRYLSMAERDELVIAKTDLSSMELLFNLAENFIPFHLTFKKTVVIDLNSEDTLFKSDKILINRILTNLIKNAREAIKEDEIVTIGTKPEDGKVIFWVHNNMVLPDEVQAKIFNRSFSTKGAGRGIGTYGVKLFTEKYLRGNAYFTSREGEGTIFYVELPLE